MIRFKQMQLRSRWVAAVAAAASLAAVMGTSVIALGQDQSISAKDIIFARKTLMSPWVRTNRLARKISSSRAKR
jgi:hypothetical protein